MKTWGAGDNSHKGFLEWRPALWCHFLFWSLSLLQRWSLLAASSCSVWSLAWLCLDGWRSWLFGSSGTAAGCLSWEVWWSRTGSTGLVILMPADRVVDCRKSMQRLLLLHLLEPVLLGCCQHQLTALSSIIILHPPLFFAKDGVVVLCVWLGTIQYWRISIGLVLAQLTAVFCHWFSTSRSSVKHSSERSWIVVACPCSP